MTEANKIQPLTLKGGATVFEEKYAGDGTMFFIFSGEVTISKQGIGTIRKLTAGHFFGEMALIKNIPRTATATVTSSEAKLGLINMATFAFLAKSNPKFLTNLLSVVAKRAARAIEKLEGHDV